MNHASGQAAVDAAGLITREAVTSDPLRHAPLVLELVNDRIGRPARGLDPMIVSRHGAAVMAQVAGLAARLVPDGAATPVHVAELTARTAIAQVIDHTHRIMMGMGHLREPEEQGALASGRTLFASELGGPAASAMTSRH